MSHQDVPGWVLRALAKQQITNEKDASVYIGMSVSFLRKSRMENPNPGPPFLRLGRAIRYRVADLDRWLEKRLQGVTD
jgi:hypothetical protein